jgi:NAD(P)-dependent dehydrogenase (short-subunit alcohol dehydrogenase family)
MEGSPSSSARTGRRIARGLARMGLTVVIGARSIEGGESAAAEIAESRQGQVNRIGRDLWHMAGS